MKWENVNEKSLLHLQYFFVNICLLISSSGRLFPFFFLSFEYLQSCILFILFSFPLHVDSNSEKFENIKKASKLRKQTYKKYFSHFNLISSFTASYAASVYTQLICVTMWSDKKLNCCRFMWTSGAKYVETWALQKQQQNFQLPQPSRGKRFSNFAELGDGFSRENSVG